MTERVIAKNRGCRNGAMALFYSLEERKSYLNQSFASLKKRGRDNTLLLEKQFENGNIYKVIFNGLCVILRRRFVLRRRDSYG